MQTTRLLLALLAGASLPAQFHDDFTAKTLDAAWAWSDPGNDASWQLLGAPARFRMIVPPGNDHTTGHGAPLYSGPMLTVPASGDFVITTHVTVNYPQAPSTMESGLMIWKDTSNNLQFKRTNGYNAQNVLYYGNIANSQTTFHGNVNVSANELYLRIVRSGSDFTSYHGTDGKTWTKAGTVQWQVTGTLQVGIATSFWLWWGSTTSPTTGDYLFFDLAPLAPGLAVDRAGLPAQAGGTIGLALDLGASHAGESYILVGGFSGSRPGTPLPGGVLPLNWDPLSDLMLANRNLAGVFPGTAGILDAGGKAAAQVIVPQAALVPIHGISLRFAGVSFPGASTTLRPTNAVAVAVAR